MQDTFAELQAAFTRLNLVLRTIDPKISLASIEVKSSRENTIALRGALAASTSHPTRNARAPLTAALQFVSKVGHTRFLSENPQRHEQRGLFRPDIGC